MTEKPDAFAVDQFVEAERVHRDTMINANDLQGEFVRQAGLVYFYTSLVARAERQHSEIKLRLEALEATCASSVRKEAQNAGEKAPTVDTVKAQVRLHPRVLRAEAALIRAKEVETMLKGVVEAMRHKRDGLQMLGFQERDERRANLAIMEETSAPGDVARRGAHERWQERLATAQA